ncbi:MAG: AAA family ATPase [Spirochaetales bacterium]|nr:AAA family ATPase [Spirochaetales bacterium]
MEWIKKNLPLGIQDFEDLQKNNYIYVDKTELMYNLVKSPKAFYFLSRPRRFG